MTEEANRLPYGLASYAFTSSHQDRDRDRRSDRKRHGLDQQLWAGVPEVPFGGVKDSGYGSEGGTEAMDAYFNTKFITQTGV